jgi:hypothetical protein
MPETVEIFPPSGRSRSSAQLPSWLPPWGFCAGFPQISRNQRYLPPFGCIEKLQVLRQLRGIAVALRFGEA